MLCTLAVIVRIVSASRRTDGASRDNRRSDGDAAVRCVSLCV